MFIFKAIKCFNIKKKYGWKIFLLVTGCLFLYTNIVYPAEQTKEIEEFSKKKRRAKNPHVDLDCTDCHKTKPREGDTKETVTFKKPINDICIECHSGESNIHPVGLEPSMKIPTYLPLDKDKKLTCATCHDVHAKEVGFTLLRGFDTVLAKYKWRTDMCYDCHGMTFLKKNPHQVIGEKRNCNYCHATEPKVSDTEKTVGFRIDILTLCNFCHNVAAKNHPLNVDTSIIIPDDLPRGADGGINCGTCHDPHGASGTVHYLRPKYIYTIEEGKYAKPHFDETLCLACHLTWPKDGQNADEVDYKFGGNFTLLCNSCHGTESNMHPIDIVPPAEMKIPETLPLRGGKMTCETCHNAGFVNRATLFLLRGFDEGGPNKEVNDLCYMCHPKEEFQKLDPHLEMKAKRKCMYCHISSPDNKDTDQSVSIKGTIKMLCIRCHSHRPHPASYSHVVKPTMIVPKDYPLDLNGEITCTTCHDAHFETQPGQTKGKNKRLRKGLTCNVCHII